MAPTTAAATVSNSGGSTPAPDDTLFGVPKWALAVAAGGVVAAGVLYFVLRSPGYSNKLCEDILHIFVKYL